MRRNNINFGRFPDHANADLLVPVHPAPPWAEVALCQVAVRSGALPRDLRGFEAAEPRDIGVVDEEGGSEVEGTFGQGWKLVRMKTKSRTGTRTRTGTCTET